MNISPALLRLSLPAGLCGGPVVLPADLLPAPGNLRPASRICAAGCLVSDPARGGCGAAPGPLRILSFFFSQICARCKLVSASLRGFQHFLNISPAFPGFFPAMPAGSCRRTVSCTLSGSDPGRGALPSARAGPAVLYPDLSCTAVRYAERADAGP